MLTLNDGRSELWQWDTGRKLTVDADCSQVHFSNKVFGRSIDVDVLDGVAIIPDILLQTDKDLFAWAFVGTPENGYTKISKVFKVNRRNKPSDYVFTPPEQTTLGEILERLDDLEFVKVPDAIKNAVEDYLEQNPVEVPVQSVNGQTGEVKLTAGDVGAISQDDLQEATNEALAQAKASGEFDGPRGPKGPQGPQGAPGANGKDAVVDSTLTQIGQAADAAKVGNKINELKDDLTQQSYYNIEQYQGYYDLNKGGIKTAGNNSICNTEKIPCFGNSTVKITVADDYNIQILWFDDSENMISSYSVVSSKYAESESPSNADSLCFNVWTSDTSKYPNVNYNVKVEINSKTPLRNAIDTIIKSVKEKSEVIATRNVLSKKNVIKHKVYLVDSGKELSLYPWNTTELIPTNGNSSICFKCFGNLKGSTVASIVFYKSNKEFLSGIDNINPETTYPIPNTAKYFRFNFIFDFNDAVLIFGDASELPNDFVTAFEMPGAIDKKDSVESVVAHATSKIRPKFGCRNTWGPSPVGFVSCKNNDVVINGGTVTTSYDIIDIDTQIKHAKHCFEHPNTDFAKDPEIHFENGIYYMFFSGRNESTDGWEVQYATSNSLTGTWTYGGTAIATPSVELPLGFIGAPTLIKRGNTWYMLITDGVKSYFATSNSLGGTWTLNTSSSVPTFDSCLFYENGIYYMVYTKNSEIWYMTSNDMISWGNDTRMFTANRFPWQLNYTEAPYLFKSNGLYYCFYGSADSGNGQRVGVAVSESLERGKWRNLGSINMVVPKVYAVSHPCVIYEPYIDKYMLYFCGSTAQRETTDYYFKIYRYISDDLINWTPYDFTTGLKSNMNGMLVMNTCGDIEYTESIQNNENYPLSTILTDSNGIVTELNCCLPYAKGYNLIDNGTFEINDDSWIVNGGSVIVDSIVKQTGFTHSCKVYSDTSKYVSISKTVSLYNIYPSEYLALNFNVKSANCENVTVNLELFDADNIRVGTETGTLNYSGSAWIPYMRVIKIPMSKGVLKLVITIGGNLDSTKYFNLSNVRLTQLNRNEFYS